MNWDQATFGGLDVNCGICSRKGHGNESIGVYLKPTVALLSFMIFRVWAGQWASSF